MRGLALVVEGMHTNLGVGDMSPQWKRDEHAIHDSVAWVSVRIISVCLVLLQMSICRHLVIGRTGMR